MVRDRYDALPLGSVRLSGILDEKIHRVIEGTLKRIDMYALADYFRYRRDEFAAGEFWGKIMRAVCLLAAYTGDQALKEIADSAARDMMSLMDTDGCLSACPRETQPNGTHGSDLWERKYVLEGLLAYHDLTGSAEALDVCARLVRYTEGQVGEPPKTPITQTGWAFCGMESSSLLAPVMRVSQKTGEPAALRLARHIISSGACARENIFEAIRQGKSPKDIGGNGKSTESIAKAYEMMSCFEGLCEYYRATGEQEYLHTAELFWERVYEEEITLLGSGGADKPYNLGPGIGEQWNHTRSEQTNPDISYMMETCVTTYWMRLCRQLYSLTGKPKYIDAIERSLYNAILGAIRPDGAFFEYFPRFNGTRNPHVNYSCRIKDFDLSCCTANGPTALAMGPALAVCRSGDELVFNLYENAEVTCPAKNGSTYHLTLDSRFPMRGELTVSMENEGRTAGETFPYRLTFRVPSYAGRFCVRVKREGKAIAEYAGEPMTYLRLPDTYLTGDTCHITFDIPLTLHRAPHGSNRAGDPYIAFTYGALVLSRDARDERPGHTPTELVSTEMGAYRIEEGRRSAYLACDVTLGRETVRLTDYQSAGDAWDGGAFATWLPIRPYE